MMKEKTNIPLQELVKKYKAINDKLNNEDRLRYAMAQTMCYGKEVNTPNMKKILILFVVGMMVLGNVSFAAKGGSRMPAAKAPAAVTRPAPAAPWCAIAVSVPIRRYADRRGRRSLTCVDRRSRACLLVDLLY